MKFGPLKSRYGYRDIRPHPLLVSFSGLPYVDVRASLNSFIPSNLSEDLAERLVEFYLNRLKFPQYHDKVEFEISALVFHLTLKIGKLDF